MRPNMNDYEIHHLDLLRSGNAGCTLLLKTDGSFPLESAGDIALYGSGVRHTIKGGTGSGEVNSRFYTNVEDGIRDAGFNVTTTGWLNRYDEVLVQAKKDFIKEVKRRAREHHTLSFMEGMGAVMPEPEYRIPLDRKCETAVYVLARNSGEGNDRRVVPGDVLLSETETRDILALQALYPKFLLVLNVGGPVDLSPVADKVHNILLLSQLGVETGAVLADLLLGKSYPSGKLATTWADSADYCTVGDFGDNAETHYREGIYVGYRYFDTVGKKARFPFGFGLGYTTFSVTPAGVRVEGDTVTVSADVKNTGRRPGREVVQIYVSVPAGRLDQPFQALAAFAKTDEMLPGETNRVEVSFRLSEIASYDTEKSAWLLEAGDYILRVGSSSVETHDAAVLRLDTEAVVRTVRALGENPGFADWVPDSLPRSSDAEVIPISAEAIPCEDTDYDREYPIEPLIQSLTDEELVYMNIGSFNPKAAIGSVIGDASFSVAGAAGETAMLFREKGIPSMVMADGPAGLRISRQYYKDSKGIHSFGAPVPESLLDYLPAIARPFLSRSPKLKKGTVLQEQYATAIPIGTAIAQSFDTEYAAACGDIVGSEMERFHVQLWLAPALNIHRSILCGRNFEYYSEDPLVSGRMAAAITNGVQKHPSCGTTIKHYCANNQETNRYNSNSHISERALREIYLRGFGICVRESQPCALMTSYNLLNGTHTSERRDLTEDILRCEFGFEGIVMTDWVAGGSMVYNSKKYPMPDAGRVAMAGGDLFMPGSQGDYKRCLAMLKSGALTRRQLEINATRVLHMAQTLTAVK